MAVVKGRCIAVEERVSIAMGGMGWKVSGCGVGSVATMKRPGWWVATLYTFRTWLHIRTNNSV